MSYLTCTNCLEKSPGEATRCKHCGRSFGPPPPPGSTSALPRIISALFLLAGVALVIGGVWWWRPSLRMDPASSAGMAPEPTPVAVPSTPAPEPTHAAPVEHVKAARVENAIVAPGAATPAPSDSTPRAAAADSTRLVRDTTRPATPAMDADPNFDPARQRYAQVFANLRAEPNKAAAVVQVLRPGEVVTVDSLLGGGWYLVVTAEQASGYVDRQYLDTLPPARP